jgi:hypothetical protein
MSEIKSQMPISFLMILDPSKPVVKKQDILLNIIQPRQLELTFFRYVKQVCYKIKLKCFCTPSENKIRAF